MTSTSLCRDNERRVDEMDCRQFAKLIVENKWGEVLVNEPMSRHTTWRIGGPADLLYYPAGQDTCRHVLVLARENKIPVTFLGNGSNILVADQGIRGLALSTSTLNNIFWRDTLVTAEAGVSLPYLAGLSAGKGLKGLEFAAGIPASVGGAAIMNAGAHGSGMDKVVTEVKTLSLSGAIKTYEREELGFAYRSSVLQGCRELVTAVTMELSWGKPGEVLAAYNKYLKERKERQPLGVPNAGSVFRNPPGDSAGRLIEAAGCKGWRIGEAQVSHKHANFIINLGRATAQEVKDLIEEVRKAVKEKSHIELETEIKLLGFDVQGR